MSYMEIYNENVHDLLDPVPGEVGIGCIRGFRIVGGYWSRRHIYAVCTFGHVGFIHGFLLTKENAMFRTMVARSILSVKRQ